MSKRKPTPAEKREKKRRRELFETIFVGGKQKRVRRSEALVEGIPEDEFIARNADPIWLHQHGLWELLEENGTIEDLRELPVPDSGCSESDEGFRPGKGRG